MKPQKLTSSASTLTTSLKTSIKKFKGVDTLRRRLLTTVLPTVLLPLAIASAIGYSITERRAKEDALSQLENNALLASDVVSIFIRDSFRIPDLVASNPEVIEAMRTGAQQAQAQGLTQQPIEAVEQAFAETKLLAVDASLNNYLQSLVETTQTVEIFFTERHGFNIAFSNPTSDFVQSDEQWWQLSQRRGQTIVEPEFDKSANTTVIALSKAVKDPQTEEFLGVIKAGIPVTQLNSDLTTYTASILTASETLQVVDAEGNVVNTITSQGADSEQEAVIGGEPILQVAQILLDGVNTFSSLEEVNQTIQELTAFSDIRLKEDDSNSLLAQLEYAGKIYSFSVIPRANLVSITTVDAEAVATASRNLLIIFALTALVLGAIAVGLIMLLARQLSHPLMNLSAKAQQVAAGDLEVQADLAGTVETRTLADNFNQLVDRVKDSLQTQQALTEEQRQEKERLEQEIYILLDEVADATEGDLTVRASLTSMEMSTVADLFNAIIDSLQEIAIEAKHSTQQVGSSLQENEVAITALARRAIAEAEETRRTLSSIEQMSQSIQKVAENASQAAKISDDTNNTVLESSGVMDQTVASILSLRTTVGETAKKMKRLGESSQKISQVVSLIEEIALKTNLLAINASVEASRAGEQGQGFTVVAEQVGALAEQSAAATKEIAQIVAAIQMETQEVTEAMELGTTQVVDTTRLVESTKQSLKLVLEKSQDINQLMRSISQATVSQADTSQTVTNLMQQIAQVSEDSSESSTRVALSILETAKVAQKLESVVAKFKVTPEAESVN